jgi:hypothetical protein
VYVLRQRYHKLGNYFGGTQCNSYVTWVMWNLISVRLKTVLVSVQDSWTVGMKHTIGLEIVLDIPDGTRW